MRKIKLTQGKYATVDDADYELVSKHTWCAKKVKNTWYAVRKSKEGNHVYMHRLILGLSLGDKRQGDHINRNGLNNQRNNLRICTLQQNHFNNGTKGIRFEKTLKKWAAYIKYNYKKYHLWNFKLK